MEGDARPSEHLTGNVVLDGLCCRGKGRREMRDRRKTGREIVKEKRKKKGGSDRKRVGGREAEKREREEKGRGRNTQSKKDI